MDELLKEASLESFLFHQEKDLKTKDTDREIESSLDSEDAGEVEFFEDEKGIESTLSKTGELWCDSTEAEVIQPQSQRSLYVKHLLSKTTTSGLTISEYEEKLRKRHRELHPNINWARVRTEEEKKETNENPSLLTSSESLLASSSSSIPLRKGRIEMTPTVDANTSDPYRSKLSSIEYSPNGELFMSASRTGRVCFFHVDNLTNPLIDSIQIKKYKLIKAGFLPGRHQVLSIGTPQFQSIHLLDLETKATERIHASDPKELFEDFTFGRDSSAELAAFVSKTGTVPIYSFNSRQWITRIQSNRKIEASIFAKNGKHLITCGVGGKMNVWDLRMFKCLSEFIDQGTLHCTAISLDLNNKYFATGSDAGVVNLYKTDDLPWTSPGDQQPTPIKSIFNLNTEINTIEFHPDSQVLAIASMHASSALRLVHLPSCNVFSNWPNQRLTNTRIKCIAFSPNKELLNVGSFSGRVSSFQLLHYVNTQAV